MTEIRRKIANFNAIMLLFETYGFVGGLGSITIGLYLKSIFNVSYVIFLGSLSCLILYYYRKNYEYEKFSKYDKIAVVSTILSFGYTVLALLITPGIFIIGYNKKIY